MYKTNKTDVTLKAVPISKFQIYTSKPRAFYNV